VSVSVGNVKVNLLHTTKTLLERVVPKHPGLLLQKLTRRRVLLARLVYDELSNVSMDEIESYFSLSSSDLMKAAVPESMSDAQTRLLIALLISKEKNSALGSILESILTHTTQAVEKIIANTDTNDFVQDEDVANACAMIPFVSDAVALISVYSKDTIALRHVLPAISSLLSSLTRVRGHFKSSSIQDTEDTIHEMERASFKTLRDANSLSLNLPSKIIPSYFWVYKPRNAEKSVRIAFSANASEQIENAYNRIAEMTPAELREQGGNLFHFDYWGEDAIALLSTAVPPGIGLQTIQLYRHQWGMRQQDGRDLIRLTGQDAVTAAHAAMRSSGVGEIRFELSKNVVKDEKVEEEEKINLPETYVFSLSLSLSLS